MNRICLLIGVFISFLSLAPCALGLLLSKHNEQPDSLVHPCNFHENHESLLSDANHEESEKFLQLNMRFWTQGKHDPMEEAGEPQKHRRSKTGTKHVTSAIYPPADPTFDPKGFAPGLLKRGIDAGPNAELPESTIPINCPFRRATREAALRSAKSKSERQNQIQDKTEFSRPTISSPMNPIVTRSGTPLNPGNQAIGAGPQAVLPPMKTGVESKTGSEGYSNELFKKYPWLFKRQPALMRNVALHNLRVD